MEMEQILLGYRCFKPEGRWGIHGKSHLTNLTISISYQNSISAFFHFCASKGGGKILSRP